MNQRYQRRPLSLGSLLVIFVSFVFLSSCNGNNGNQQTGQQPQSPSGESATPGQSPVASGNDGVTPITAGLPDSDRPATDPLQLVQTQQVRSELNLTDEQLTKLKQINTDLRNKLQQKVAGVDVKTLDAKQQEQKLKEIDQLTQEARQEVAGVLKPEQITRMRQILLQVYGWGPLTKNDLKDSLKVTPAQDKQLDEIREQTIQKMRSNWEIPGNDPQQREKVIANNRKRMDQIIKEANQQSLAVLTPEQQKSLEQLKGKEFKLDTAQLQPPSS